jgi:hypothetical protein
MVSSDNPNAWYGEQRLMDLHEHGRIAFGARSFFRPAELLLTDGAVNVLRNRDPAGLLTSSAVDDGGYGGTPREGSPPELAVLGLQLWTITADVDVRVAAAELQARAIRFVDPEDDRLLRVSVNHVFFGDTHKPIGSPWGAPALATTDRPVAPASTQEQAVIAVLDTGVPSPERLRLWHPELEGSIRRNAANPYVQNDEDHLYVPGAADPRQLAHEAGHGTFIAGLIHLIAPDAAINPFAVLSPDGDGDDAHIAAALVAVTTAGAATAVVNMSLGGTTEDDEPPLALELAVFAVPGSTVVVASAGNEISRVPHWPAAIKGVVSVGAIDQNVGGPVVPTAFTDSGVWVDVSTLGQDLVSTYVEGNYPTGQGAPVGFPAAAPMATWSGTSFAAPVIAAEIVRRMTQSPAGGPRPNGPVTAEEAWVELRSELRLDAGAPDLGVVYQPQVQLKG